MTDIKYLVNISYQPPVMTGQQAVNIAGITYSVPVYSSGFFVASMPEVRIVGTGSSYQNALTALLAVASSTTDPGNGPLSSIRFS